MKKRSYRKRKVSHKALAARIASELFRVGEENEAQRLVLRVHGKSIGWGGGWCKEAVEDVILRHLREAEGKVG